MIFYFSGTGNTLFAARQVAEVLGDKNLIAIDECVREERFDFTLQEREMLGICCPTYDWGIPHLVQDFLQKAHFDGTTYSFALTTFGTTSGQSTGLIRNLLKKQGIILSAAFTIQTVDVWTPMFNLTNKDKNQRLVDGEQAQLEIIIARLLKRDKGNFAHKQLPMWMAKALYKTYDNKRKTCHLHTTDACIGCGLCAKKCPAQAIEMVDKRPVWKKTQCEMCLGCLHRCPKFAIQYDQKTQKHGQYQHKQYEKK